MTTTEEINNRIEKMGLKKKHVAEKCDIGLAMFSLFLKGKRNLRDEQKIKLNKFLGLA